MASIADAAAHIFIGERRFYELLADNVFENEERGQWDLDKIRKAYIEHLRKVAAGRGLNSDVDLSEERAKLAREQAEGVALKNAIARGEYAPIDVIIEKVESEYGIVRERLLAIPSKLANPCAQKDRDVIESLLMDEIIEALEELHGPSESPSETE